MFTRTKSAPGALPVAPDDGRSGAVSILPGIPLPAELYDLLELTAEAPAGGVESAFAPTGGENVLPSTTPAKRKSFSGLRRRSSGSEAVVDATALADRPVDQLTAPVESFAPEAPAPVAAPVVHDVTPEAPAPSAFAPPQPAAPPAPPPPAEEPVYVPLGEAPSAPPVAPVPVASVPVASVPVASVPVAPAAPPAEAPAPEFAAFAPPAPTAVPVALVPPAAAPAPAPYAPPAPYVADVAPSVPVAIAEPVPTDEDPLLHTIPRKARFTLRRKPADAEVDAVLIDAPVVPAMPGFGSGSELDAPAVAPAPAPPAAVAAPPAVADVAPAPPAPRAEAPSAPPVEAPTTTAVPAFAHLVPNQQVAFPAALEEVAAQVAAQVAAEHVAQHAAPAPAQPSADRIADAEADADADADAESEAAPAVGLVFADGSSAELDGPDSAALSHVASVLTGDPAPEVADEGVTPTE